MGGEAATHGCSREGPWTMSSHCAKYEALSETYLTHEGLVKTGKPVGYLLHPTPRGTEFHNQTYKRVQ